MSWNRFFVALLILTSLATTLAGVLQIRNGLNIQTDLLSLLPPTSKRLVDRQAHQRLTEQAGDAFILLLADSDKQSLLDAHQVIDPLLSSNPFIQLDKPQQQLEQQLQYFEALKPYRFQLLSPAQRTALNENSESILQQAWQALYSPGNMANIASVIEDPLNLFNGYLEQTYQNSVSQLDAELVDNTLIINGPEPAVFMLISGQVTPGAFSLEAQQAISDITASLSTLLNEQHPSIQLYRAGAVFHGAQAAKTAKQEITLIATGSSLGILLLFIVSFRSLRPLFLSISSIAYGSLCALVFCQWYFHSVHLLTLVFGASLIGVAVDYALHYLTRTGHGNGRQLIRCMLPSLAMGLGTSLIGYSSLLQAPLPGLQQMAVFSMVGLAAAWLFVVVVFPQLQFKSPATMPTLLDRLALLPQKFWARLSRPQLTTSLAIIILLALPILFSQFRAADNIRVLYTPEPQLVQQQQAISSVLPAHSPNQFYLISHSDEQQLLSIASQFKSSLEELVAAGSISGYQLLSDFVPPALYQQKNHRLLLDTAYQPAGIADELMQTAGFNQRSIEHIRQQLESPFKPLTLEHWASIAPTDKQLLWLGETGGQSVSLVLLFDASDLSRLERAASQYAEIRFVDTVRDISTTLAEKRRSASRLLLFAYIAIALLLLIRYRKRRSLVLVMLPILSSLITVTLLSLAGVAISLFHVFALFLVLGLGMDYGIFLYESANTAPATSTQPQLHCQRAILLSVLTSGLSFGLLSFSSTPMISAFGITVLIGSLLNWVLVPLVLKAR